jgi:hypothetical protein
MAKVHGGSLGHQDRCGGGFGSGGGFLKVLDAVEASLVVAVRSPGGCGHGRGRYGPGGSCLHGDGPGCDGGSLSYCGCNDWCWCQGHPER